jgi:hypothetical protein
MTIKTQSSAFLVFMVTVSIFGLATISMLTLSPPRSEESPAWRRPLVGSVFTIICLTGMAAAFFPKTCSQMNPQEGGKAAVSDSAEPLTRASRGHHPNCEKFSAHTVRIDDSFLCASCTGLLTGAILALIGTALYFFTESDWSRIGSPAVLIGEAGIVLGFLQFKLRNSARSAANASFVLAAFLVLVGVDTLSKSAPIDFYALGLVVFWLFTRISISKWNNRRICGTCTVCKLDSVSPSAHAVQGANND